MWAFAEALPPGRVHSRGPDWSRQGSDWFPYVQDLASPRDDCHVLAEILRPLTTASGLLSRGHAEPPRGRQRDYLV
jgi:hypothetical protein